MLKNIGKGKSSLPHSAGVGGAGMTVIITA